MSVFVLLLLLLLLLLYLLLLQLHAAAAARLPRGGSTTSLPTLLRPYFNFPRRFFLFKTTTPPRQEMCEHFATL